MGRASLRLSMIVNRSCLADNVGRSREDVAEVCGSLTVDKGGGGVVGVEPKTVPGAVGVGRDAG